MALRILTQLGKETQVECDAGHFHGEIPAIIKEFEMYQGVKIADLHSHALLSLTYLGQDISHLRSPPRFRNPFLNQIDLEKILRGGIDLQVFTIYVPFRYPWASYFDAYRWQVDHFQRFIQENSEVIGHARTPSEAERLNEQGKIAAILAVEGAHIVESDLSRLDILQQDGVFYLTLTHLVANRIASAATFPWTRDRGLTSLGKELLIELETRQMLPDIAHCSPSACTAVTTHAQGPVISSHTGLYDLKPLRRNLTESQVQAIKHSGGVVGVIFFARYLSPGTKTKGIQAIVQTIDELISSSGAQLPAIGTDFGGWITPVRGLPDSSAMPKLIDTLLEKYPLQIVKDIMGGNAVRIMSKARWGAWLKVQAR